MAVPTVVWFIVETVLIPDGLRKWICLSFFIHPSFLFFCQIFLWLNHLTHCLVVVLLLPLRGVYASCLFVLRTLRKCVVFVAAFVIRPRESDSHRVDEEFFEAQHAFGFDQSCPEEITAASVRYVVELLEFEEYALEDSADRGEDGTGNPLECPHRERSDDYEDLVPSTSSEEAAFHAREGTITEEQILRVANSFVAEEYSNVETGPLFSYESPDRDDQCSLMSGFSVFQIFRRGTLDEEPDVLYNAYTEQMRWFDVLNHERACGISAIENEPIGNPSPSLSIEFLDSASGILRITWSKKAAKTLLRSFENDFERVYVAQSCLSWSALFHQYSKVKAIEASTSKNSHFCSVVAGEFQKFQILLERFMENEQSEGKRVWNFVRERFSLKGLLQVPNISVKGLMMEDKGNMKGEGTNIRGVLKVIEECIEAFWKFVKTDNSHKSWWKIRTSSRTYPVEDPRDLHLLSNLTTRLQKKKLLKKDLEGKKRCMLKRVENPMIEESQRREMVYTAIDMKLVSRVLQMSTISSSQLKWCQQKLDNLEFKDGKVFRASNDPLFPHN